MEEIAGALLGYYGTHITAAGTIDAELQAHLHPVELTFVTDSLSLGKDYSILNLFVTSYRAGRLTDGLLVGLGAGLAGVLDDYHADVLALEGPAQLLALHATYGPTLSTLTKIVSCPEAGERQQALFRFIMSPTTPISVRRTIGTHYAATVQLSLAHWVAHGVLPAVTTFLGSPAQHSGGTSSTGLSQAAVDAKHLPLGMPARVAALALRAGTVRRVLRFEPPDPTPPSSASADADATASADVFRSLVDPSLIGDGLLHWDEVESRVEAARVMWSDVLWNAVRESCQLFVHLEVLRDCFLTHRGDLWSPFVEESFAIVGTLRPGQRFGSAETSTISASFLSALRQCGLSERPVFETCNVTILGGTLETLGPATRSHEEVGRLLVQRVRRLSLNCVFSPGVGMIVCEADVEQYMATLALFMMLRFTQRALVLARRRLMEFDRSTALSHNRGGDDAAAGNILPVAFAGLVNEVAVVVDNLSQVLHMDVVATHFRQLEFELKTHVRSVEAAKAAHNNFISKVFSGAFLGPEDASFATAIEAACIIGMALFSFAEKEFAMVESSRHSFDANAFASLKALKVLTAQHVTNPLCDAAFGRRQGMSGLDASTGESPSRHAEAMCTRMDVSGWFARRAASAAHAAPQLSAATRAKISGARAS